MVDVMKSPSELTEEFRSRGLKVTPQRQCIFRILHDTQVHPTAEAVHAQAQLEMPTMSLRTVYQTLNDLAAMGELAQLRLGTGPARFDPNTAPHLHLVCTGCGAIHDLHGELAVIMVPPGAPAGFVVNSTEVVFRGRCRACRRDDAALARVAAQTFNPQSSSTHHKEARERNG
jgi:Fe2+ or Zn2+ uptake regulation protein